MFFYKSCSAESIDHLKIFRYGLTGIKNTSKGRNFQKNEAKVKEC